MKNPATREVYLQSTPKPLEHEPSSEERRFLRKWTDGLFNQMVEGIAPAVIADLQQYCPRGIKRYDEAGQFVYAPVIRHALSLVMTDLAANASEPAQPIAAEVVAIQAHDDNFSRFRDYTGVTNGDEQLLAMDIVAHRLGELPLLQAGVDMYWRDIMVTIQRTGTQPVS